VDRSRRNSEAKQLPLGDSDGSKRNTDSKKPLKIDEVKDDQLRRNSDLKKSLNTTELKEERVRKNSDAKEDRKKAVKEEEVAMPRS